MNYHLSISRAVLEIIGEADEFDVVDAFDAALDDWERDTDHGALPGIHQDAFIDSLFELVDVYTTTLKESEYIDFARLLKKHSTVKRKGHACLHFRHEWPTYRKPGRFLSQAVLAIREKLEKPERTAPVRRGAGAKSSSGKQQLRSTPAAPRPPMFRLRRIVDALRRRPALGHSQSSTHRTNVNSTSAAAVNPTHNRWRKARLAMVASRPLLDVTSNLEQAALRLFDKWATPIYADINLDELRLIDPNYIGNRRHADDECAVRLGDLALMLAHAGVALTRDEHGLPQLLALYHFLDFDGDGWITRGDFAISVLESVIDVDHPGHGPRLPQSSIRGGPHRRHAAAGKSTLRGHISRRARKGQEVKRSKHEH